MRVIAFRLAVLAIYAPPRIAHKSALTSLTSQPQEVRLRNIMRLGERNNDE